MCGKDAKPKRTCACQKCGAELDAGLRGPPKKWCMMCRKTPPCRKIPTCRHCGVVTGLSLKRRWPITVCQDCKDEHAKARAKRAASTRNTCTECGVAFVGNPWRKYCPPCRQKKFSAKKVACIECGEVFRKSRQGGKSKGLFCTNRCRGIHQRRANGTEARMRQRQRFMRIAKHERAAMHRQRRMRKELEKIVTFVVKRALTVCRQCGGSMPLLKGYGVQGGASIKFCSRRCLRRAASAACKTKRRSEGLSVNTGHQSRCRKRGLPRMYGRCVSLKAVGERDRWVCQLCNKPTAGSSRDCGPLSPCVDHIVPIGHPGNRSHGHVPNNIQIAHRVCNESNVCSIACPSLLDCINPREHVRMNGINQTPQILQTGVVLPTNGPFGGKPHATSG